MTKLHFHVFNRALSIAGEEHLDKLQLLSQLKSELYELTLFFDIVESIYNKRHNEKKYFNKWFRILQNRRLQINRRHCGSKNTSILTEPSTLYEVHIFVQFCDTPTIFLGRSSKYKFNRKIIILHGLYVYYKNNACI